MELARNRFVLSLMRDTVWSYISVLSDGIRDACWCFVWKVRCHLGSTSCRLCRCLYHSYDEEPPPAPILSIPIQPRRIRPETLIHNPARPPTSNPHSLIFFFSSRRRHTRFDCDWSSDVCSSD